MTIFHKGEENILLYAREYSLCISDFPRSFCATVWKLLQIDTW